MSDQLRIPLGQPPEGREAGLFLSRGRGRHLTRTRGDWELIVVRRGRLPIAEDGADRSVAAGEWLLLAPGHRHGGTAAYAPDLEFHWLHFAATGDGRDLVLPARGQVPAPARVAELLLRYEAGELHPLGRSGIVLELLGELATRPRRDGSALAQRADQVVARRFHEAISTVDVAAELGVHPDHLGRAYRAARGRSVLQEIQRRRIADAQELLLTGDAAQEEIARECGFSDVRYFRRVFRAVAGTSPGAWRDARRGGRLNSR